MSLTAIFKRAPQRYSEVGPSLEANQPTVYRNSGISLSVFKKEETIANFTAIVGQAKLAMLRDRNVLSYASASLAPDYVGVIASYVDASADLLPSFPQIFDTSIVEFEIEDSNGFVYPSAKHQIVSIEA